MAKIANMTRALTADQIATCERDGHKFAWVRAWHDCGFYECERCGATKRQASELGEAVALMARLDASRLELGKAFAEGLAAEIDRRLMAEIHAGRSGS